MAYDPANFVRSPKKRDDTDEEKNPDLRPPINKRAHDSNVRDIDRAISRPSLESDLYHFKRGY
jgi:hypothetical protein